MAGDGGKGLSGGERQRIALARAILKDAPIVVLDEATAFLDPENEEKMNAAIAEVIRGKTVIVIAHRLQSIAGADHCILFVFWFFSALVDSFGTSFKSGQITCPYNRQFFTVSLFGFQVHHFCQEGVGAITISYCIRVVPVSSTHLSTGYSCG